MCTGKLIINNTIDTLYIIYTNIALYYVLSCIRYERMYPVYNNTVTQYNYDCLNMNSSTIHIINGAAGNVETSELFDPSSTTIDAYVDTKNIGFSMITIHNSTSLTYKALRGNDSSVLDEITIFKQRTNKTC